MATKIGWGESDVQVRMTMRTPEGSMTGMNRTDGEATRTVTRLHEVAQVQ